jgi:hypothetical protein
VAVKKRVVANPKGKVPKLYVEKIPLDRQGYTKRGEYFGVGAPLYSFEFEDGPHSYTNGEIRANSRADAISQIKHKYAEYFRGSATNPSVLPKGKFIRLPAGSRAIKIDPRTGAVIVATGSIPRASNPISEKKVYTIHGRGNRLVYHGVNKNDFDHLVKLMKSQGERPKTQISKHYDQ